MIDDSLGSDYGIASGYYGCVSDQSQYDVLEEYLGVPLGYTSGLMLHSDEGIKLGSTDGELIVFTLVIYY